MRSVVEAPLSVTSAAETVNGTVVTWLPPLPSLMTLKKLFPGVVRVSFSLVLPEVTVSNVPLVSTAVAPVAKVRPRRSIVSESPKLISLVAKLLLVPVRVASSRSEDAAVKVMAPEPTAAPLAISNVPACSVVPPV